MSSIALVGGGLRIRRAWKAALLLAVGAAGGGAALAVASVPDSNGLIHACVEVTTTTGGVVVPDQKAANVTVIDPSAAQHCIEPDGTDTIQTELSWNARGPRGLPGKSVTVAGGNTLTLAGGDVVTVGSSHGVTVTTPTLTGNSKPIGFVELGGGLKFPLYSYDLAGKGTATSGGTGAPTIHEISITKRHDAASTTLFKYCTTGKHFAMVTIVLRKAGGKPQEYLKFELKDVLITSIQVSGHADQPTESLSLNFTKIEYKNVAQ